MSWIGVDLDGTLARYDGWDGSDKIGEPIPLMLERVKKWLSQGIEVRIVTARANDPAAKWAIREWMLKHIGVIIPVTSQKDYSMSELWDDRAIQVEKNTGIRVDGK